jgi:hypothetical protein
MAAVSSLIAVGTAAAGAAASRRASKRQDRAAQSANDAQMAQLEMAREQWDTWKKDYQPLEQQLVKDASQYDTTERREEAALTAEGGQISATDQAMRTFGETLGERGIAPTSGGYQSGLRDILIRGAASRANAGNQARRQIEDTGFARRTAVAGIGRNLPGSAQAGMSAAANGLSNTANMYGQQAQNNAQGAANLVGGVGNALAKWWNTPSNGGWSKPEPQYPINGFE